MKIDKVLIIATSIIRNSKNEILLLQRSNKSSFSGYWQLVEGKLDNKETPEVALVREIKEELGLSVSDMRFNFVNYSLIQVKSMSYLCIRVVFSVVLSSENIQISNEHISYGWFSKENLLKLKLLDGTVETIKQFYSKLNIN